MIKLVLIVMVPIMILVVGVIKLYKGNLKEKEKKQLKKFLIIVGVILGAYIGLFCLNLTAIFLLNK